MKKVWWVILVTALVVTGIGIWTLNTSSKKPGKPAVIYDEDPYADWNYYASKIGGFTLRHPEAWYLVGWRSGQQVEEVVFNGHEDTLEFTAKSNLEITEDNFKLRLVISKQKPVAENIAYRSGTTKKLPNGLTAWRDSSSDCPSYRIGTDNTFSALIKNGAYFSAHGGFCLQSGMTTAKSYEAQITSNEWKTAEAIIASLDY